VIESDTRTVRPGNEGLVYRGCTRCRWRSDWTSVDEGQRLYEQHVAEHHGEAVRRLVAAAVAIDAHPYKDGAWAEFRAARDAIVKGEPEAVVSTVTDNLGNIYTRTSDPDAPLAIGDRHSGRATFWRVVEQ
jgi:hypothetical protein